MSYHVIVCAGIVPDPLQTLEPVEGAAGPALKNESMLPSVLDPWAAHALYESAALVREHAGSRLWLVSVAPKARLQQVMTTVAQKAPFELVVVDGPSSGFVDSAAIAGALGGAIEAIEGLDRSRLLLCGGWESASRCGGTTLQMIGERLGIVDQFVAVDRLAPAPGGGFEVLERTEGGRHQVSVCDGPPAVIGWATGSRPEPANSPQVGMANMRTIVPALQRARPFAAVADGLSFSTVAVPPQRRQTRIVKDQPVEAIAAEIVAWIRG
jgi:electron transfer flavoprotein beta subunit